MLEKSRVCFSENKQLRGDDSHDIPGSICFCYVYDWGDFQIFAMFTTGVISKYYICYAYDWGIFKYHICYVYEWGDFQVPHLLCLRLG